MVRFLKILFVQAAKFLTPRGCLLTCSYFSITELSQIPYFELSLSLSFLVLLRDIIPFII